MAIQYNSLLSFELCVSIGIILITALILLHHKINSRKTGGTLKENTENFKKKKSPIKKKKQSRKGIEIFNMNSNESSSNPAIVSNNTDNDNKSALQDNIERKGKNAYYFAHAHKANGPKWDGKAEPKLLHKFSSSSSVNTPENDFQHLQLKPSKLTSSSFDYNKSNITSYAFIDEPKKVKIYVNLKGVKSKCQNEEDVELNFTESSLALSVKNYSDQMQSLCFRKLYGTIESATYRIKEDKIILTLIKTKQDGDVCKEWKSVSASSS